MLVGFVCAFATRLLKDFRDNAVPKVPTKIDAAIQDSLIDAIAEIEESMFAARQNKHTHRLMIDQIGDRRGYAIHIGQTPTPDQCGQIFKFSNPSFLILTLKSTQNGGITINDIGTGQSLELGPRFRDNAPFWAARMVAARIIREMASEPEAQAQFIKLIGTPDDLIFGGAIQKYTGKPPNDRAP